MPTGADGVPQSSRHARGRRQSAGGDLEPLSRRLLQAAGVLSALLILVVANSLLHSDENPLNPVAAAAERTGDLQGLRFTMLVITTSEAHPREVAHVDGAFNAELGLAHAMYSVPTPGGAQVRAEAVVEDDAIYLRSSQFESRLPEGKEWVEMSPLMMQDSEDSLPGESPESSLQMLGASDRVRPVGRRRVRGVETRRYVTDLRMTVLAAKLRAEGEDDLAENCERIAAQVIGPAHAETFIDGRGLLRRIRMRITVTTGGAAETAEMTMDFFDFDARPQIQVPPEAEVFDMRPLLEAQQDALGQSS